MRARVLVTSILSTLLFAAPGPAAESDELLTVLNDQIRRNMDELRMEGAPDPYWVSYTVQDRHEASARAIFGKLLASSESRRRPTRVDVRVGSYEEDNGNYEERTRGGSIGGASLPIETNYTAQARDLWSVTDGAYKAAIEELSAKRAALAGLPTDPDEEPPPHFSRVQAVESIDLSPMPEPDREWAEATAERLSAIFLEDTMIMEGRADASDNVYRRYLVNSEGTRIVSWTRMLHIRVNAMALAVDGREIRHSMEWVARVPTDLPVIDDMEDTVRAMVANMQARLSSERPKKSYRGPVVFENRAAAELFRQLLVPQLRGSPGEVEQDMPWSRGDRGTSIVAEDGERVLPLTFDVVDDPTSLNVPGGYAHDDDGVPAAELVLIRDGRVVSHYMSRLPGAERREPNGHGRGGLDSRITGQPAIMHVRARGGVAWPKVYKAAFKEAKKQGLDHIVVVREVEPRGLGGRRNTLQLGAPIELVRVFRDGREEVLRGFAFSDVGERTLRDVTAWTKHEYLHSHFMPVPGARLQTTIITPRAVLVREMDLAVLNEEPRKLPLMERP